MIFESAAVCHFAIKTLKRVHFKLDHYLVLVLGVSSFHYYYFLGGVLRSTKHFL